GGRWLVRVVVVEAAPRGAQGGRGGRVDRFHRPAAGGGQAGFVVRIAVRVGPARARFGPSRLRASRPVRPRRAGPQLLQPGVRPAAAGGSSGGRGVRPGAAPGGRLGEPRGREVRLVAGVEVAPARRGVRGEGRAARGYLVVGFGGAPPTAGPGEGGRRVRGGLLGPRPAPGRREVVGGVGEAPAGAARGGDGGCVEVV